MTCTLLIGPESFVTFVTSKWMLPCMNGHVHFEMGPVFETRENRYLSDQ